MESNKTIEFICLGSGSTGNAYVLKKGDECVLVECGFEYKKIISKLLNVGLSVSQIKAVIVTHEHNDHCKALKNFISVGIPCYAPECLVGSVDPSCVVKNKTKFNICSWLSVYCFSVNHDCDAYGYAFLDKETKESILFINDTAYFDFDLAKVRFDYIFIECNHIRNQLEAIKTKALIEGRTGEAVKFERQATFHLSLAALKKFLNKMDLSQTKCIFLMHQSKQCCNSVACQREIKIVYNVKTYCCGKDGGFC